MDNQSKEGDVWEERSLSFLREKKKDVLKRDSKEFWKKKWGGGRREEGGGIGNLRSVDCIFFFFGAITLEIYKVQGACTIRSLPGTHLEEDTDVFFRRRSIASWRELKVNIDKYWFLFFNFKNIDIILIVYVLIILML